MPSSNIPRRMALKTGAVFLGLSAHLLHQRSRAHALDRRGEHHNGCNCPCRSFTFGTASQPLGLDPALVYDVESHRVTRQILEGLVGVDQTTGEPTPLLATEWTESADGCPTPSPSAPESSSTTAPPSMPTPSAPISTAGSTSPRRSGSRLRALPSRESSRHTPTRRSSPSSRPAPPCQRCGCGSTSRRRFTGFLQALTLPAFAISSPKALAAGKADNLSQRRGGQAAFRLRHSIRWAPAPTSSPPGTAGQRHARRPTRSTGATRGQIATLKFVTYDHPQTRLQALLDGKIDGYDAVTVGNFDQLVKRGKQIIQRDPFSVMYLGMNQEIPVLKDLKVRQAIEMAIDKDTLIRRFFIDNTAQASQFVPPKLSGFNNNAPALGHDPGQGEGTPGRGRLQGRGTEVLLPHERHAALPAHAGEGLRRNQPPAHGSRPEHQAGPRRLDRRLPAEGHSTRATMPCTCSAGTVPTPTRTTSWAPLFGEKNGEFGYQDPQVFSKIDRARGLPDGQERTEQYQTINAQIAASVPAVPIAFPISALALSDRVIKLSRPRRS